MNPRRDWLAGLTVGAWAGFALVYFPFVGAVLMIGFTLGAVVKRATVALGGLLLGAGTAMLAMLLLASSSCQAGCTAPDVTGFVVAGSSMALVGGIVSVRAVTMARMRSG